MFNIKVFNKLKMVIKTPVSDKWATVRIYLKRMQSFKTLSENLKKSKIMKLSEMDESQFEAVNDFL